MGQHSGKLKPEVLQDLSHNTSFSEKELQQRYKHFLQTNPSGVLRLDEFQSMYEAVFPNGDASKLSKYVFETFDVNGDNVIDFREFICALSITSRGNTTEKLEWAFSLYDPNGNGYISHAEALEIITALYKMKKKEEDSDHSTAEETVERIFRELDRDLDGNISKQEFIEGSKSKILCGIVGPVIVL